MIRFVETEFNSVLLYVPVVNGKPWADWAGNTIQDYPSYCGAGEGIGNLIIPDRIWFLPVSVACHIHDVSWELAEPTEQDRKSADTVFLANMLRVIEAESNWFMRILRNQRAMTYYNAVDCKKNNVFWNLKRAQAGAAK